ncbi:Nramp family divalent metal transporter [Paraburkholderia rhizosphaerae]|uniref:Divalent metal cation transporter MntH n=1 Tax=Paraburkholderia rhizosphaerae TaxID=480658 RepID=A0A4V3HDS9_9BURK|nr:Nramp family divalent metal transporter [Paraburkholderia rhizosphaerae]TDY42214.1 manganese transport protein [Paraburkholderia rhizosphaerae]
MQILPLSRPGAATAAVAVGLTQRTEFSVRAALEGRSTGLGAFLPFVGPALIASVGYMDPGNFATNIGAGARYGYELLWVVLISSAVAMLFQALSARLGIVTGLNLAELCRDHFPRRLTLAMWIASEVAAMATDLAEFLGGALALSLLFHLPMLASMAVIAIVTAAILSLEKRGFRPLEIAIAALVTVIGATYLCELFIAPPDWPAVIAHTFVPHLQDKGALTLAVGIVGATIMPHTLYLHSGLTQKRVVAQHAGERRTLIRYSNREVMLALGAAAFVNMAMVIMSATVFHHAAPDTSDIDAAYRTLIPLLGSGAAILFLVALLASGVSSSVVGTMAGQVIMQGFVRFRIPVTVRRLVTVVPSFAVVALGCNVTHAMVISQVVLSMALPMPMIALLILSRKRSVMGAFAIGKRTVAFAGAAALLIVGLNVVLIYQAVA